MKLKLLNLFLLLIAAAFFFSCRENSLEKLRENELKKLAEYIQNNYHDLKPLPSGLYFDKVSEGTGDSLIKAGDRVQIYYATWTLDSLLLDETNGYTSGYRYDPFEFVVGTDDAIQGLQQAVTMMKKGGVANLVIPSELAYGQTGSIGIGGFTTLLMQIEIYKVYPAGSQ